MTRPAPAGPGVWWLAIRPKTLPAAAAPVAVGTAVAFEAGGFRAGPALAALVGALALQAGANLANDVADFERGADTAERTGPLRVTQAGLLRPADVRRGAAVAFGVAAAAGAYLTAVAGWPVVAIGVASIVAAVAYTAGPFPLGYHGLGDLFVLIFFGFVAVCGTAWVQLGRVPALAWPAGLMAGALATAILVVNNVRDLETDARAGKRTLPARLGRTWGLVEFAALLAVAYLTPTLVAAAGWLPAGGLACWLTAPRAVRVWRRLARARGPALNPVLGATATLMLTHSLLFAAGLAVHRLLAGGGG